MISLCEPGSDHVKSIEWHSYKEIQYLQKNVQLIKFHMIKKAIDPYSNFILVVATQCGWDIQGSTGGQELLKSIPCPFRNVFMQYSLDLMFV